MAKSNQPVMQTEDDPMMEGYDPLQVEQPSDSLAQPPMMSGAPSPSMPSMGAPEVHPDAHEAMREHEDKAALNRGSMLALNPMDPNYLQQVAAHQTHGDLLKNDHVHTMAKMNVPMGEQAPTFGGSPEEMFKAKTEGYKDEAQSAEDAGDHMAAGQAQTAGARYSRMHPWGTPENHPGVLGKIGHVLGTIGNVAGNAFLGPQNMAMIPGTQANISAKEKGGAAEEAFGQKEQNEQSENALRGTQEKEGEARIPAIEAGTEHTKAETEKLQNAPDVEPTALQSYTKAVQDAIAHGQDPAKSPVVQQWADAITGIQKQGPEKTPPTKTIQGPDGKSHIMERDPQTGDYSIDRGIAPPSFAQIAPALTNQKLEAQTKDLVDPEGIAHIQAYDPKTKTYSRDMGVSGTGTQGSRLFASGISKQAGETLIQDIQAHRNDLGTLGAWVQSKGLNTPIANPELAELQAELASFAALQPAQHGFRSHSAMEAFQAIIGGLQKNPDATIASIRGITKTTSLGLPKGDHPTVGGGGNGGGGGKVVSLAAAKKLEVNKGKSDEEIKKHITDLGYKVGD